MAENESSRPNINVPAVLKSIEKAQEGFKGQFLFLGESNHNSPAKQALHMDDGFFGTLLRSGYPVYVAESIREPGEPLIGKLSDTYATIDERMGLHKVNAEIDNETQIQIQEAASIAGQTGESLDDAMHRLEACRPPTQRKYYHDLEKDVHLTAMTANAIRDFANGRRTALSYGLNHGVGEGELFELLGGRENVRLVALYDNKEAMMEAVQFQGSTPFHYAHRPDAAILLDTGQLIMPAPAPDMTCKPPPKINPLATTPVPGRP